MLFSGAREMESTKSVKNLLRTKKQEPAHRFGTNGIMVPLSLYLDITKTSLFKVLVSSYLGFMATAHARAKRFRSPPLKPRITIPPASSPPMALVLTSNGIPTRSKICEILFSLQDKISL